MEKEQNLMTEQHPIPPPLTRESIKSRSHFNSYPIWKQKLRENCYKRVREDRNRLLWRLRLPSSSSQHSASVTHQDYIKNAFQDIVSDELKKMKHDNDMKVPDTAPDITDILWEYDGSHDAYQGECEEILLEMQRIFYQDLAAEQPPQKEPDNLIDIWEDELDEYLARAVLEHMQLNDDQVHKEIWCPICKQGQLQENHQLIYCNLCELQLSKSDEVNLETLQTRLADVHAEHLDRGCKLKPKFCVEMKFGLTALYICCEDCKMLEIVV